MDELNSVLNILPNKTPNLKRLSFQGPEHVGLSTIHLKLYGGLENTQVSIENSKNCYQVESNGVYFNYNTVDLTWKNIIDFRREMKYHGLFSLQLVFDQHYQVHIKVEGFIL